MIGILLAGKGLFVLAKDIGKLIESMKALRTAAEEAVVTGKLVLKTQMSPKHPRVEGS